MKKFLNWLFPLDKVQKSWDNRRGDLKRIFSEFEDGGDGEVWELCGGKLTGQDTNSK